MACGGGPTGPPVPVDPRRARRRPRRRRRGRIRAAAVALGVSMTLSSSPSARSTTSSTRRGTPVASRASPSPAGSCRRAAARVVAGPARAAGLALASVGGPWLVLLAAVVPRDRPLRTTCGEGHDALVAPVRHRDPAAPGVRLVRRHRRRLPGPVPRARPGRRERRDGPRDRERDRRHRARPGGRRPVDRPRARPDAGVGWLVVVLHAVVAVLASGDGGRPRGADRVGGRDPARRGSCRSAGRCSGSWRRGGERDELARARVGGPGGGDGAARGRVAGALGASAGRTDA